ncbi:MAG: hypothetical protein QME94_10325, partial [Anaerolineae bacterium]|nr:hypothetical protein [Anaerolineae bacterium]
MSEGERIQAEELDAHITALHAGQQPLEARGVSAAEAQLLARLHGLAANTEPSPRFVAQLEGQLRAAARSRAARPSPRPGWARGSGAWLVLRKLATDARVISSLAGVAVLAAVAVLA